MSLPASGTLLVLSVMGTPLYSARGLSQTLTPITAAADLERDINGLLDDLSLAQFRKYISKITCTDQRTPAIDGIWPGQQLDVSCVVELSYITSGGTPSRTVVSSSSRTEGSYTFYRPKLTMRVTNYDADIDEWNATLRWELDLEEV